MPAPLSANLWKLKAIRVFFWMHFFAAVLVPFYTEWGGLKLSQVLFLNAWFMLWNFLLEVPTGALADRFGRKVSLVAGSAVGAVAALVYASEPSFARFLLAEVVFAAAYTFHSGADEALAYDSLKALGRETESKKTLAAMEAFKLSGILLATVAGGFIAAELGFRAPLLAYVLPAGAAGLLALTLKEPPRTGPGLSTDYFQILKDGAGHLAGHRVLQLLMAEMAVTNALAWAVIWLFQPALQRAGLPIAFFGLVHGAAALGQILVMFRVDPLERRLGSKRRLLIWSAVGSGLAYLVLGWAGSLYIVVPAVVAAFTLGLPRAAVFGAYIHKHVPSDRRATVLSLVSMARTLGIVVMNPLIGWSADWSVPGTFTGLGAAMLLVTFFSRIEEKHLPD